MTDTLSLRDRYLALADGKTLQWAHVANTDSSGVWHDYDPCHGWSASCLADPNRIFRVKPEPELPPARVIDNGTLAELQQLVAHTGAKPFDHLEGVLSQLSNICAGFVLDQQQLEAIKAGDLCKLTTGQVHAVGQAANTLLQDYEKAQAHQISRANLSLRRALTALIRACGGNAGEENSDGYLTAAAASCGEAVQARNRAWPCGDRLRCAVISVIALVDDTHTGLAGISDDDLADRLNGIMARLVERRPQTPLDGLAAAFAAAFKTTFDQVKKG